MLPSFLGGQIVTTIDENRVEKGVEIEPDPTMKNICFEPFPSNPGTLGKEKTELSQKNRGGEASSMIFNNNFCQDPLGSGMVSQEFSSKKLHSEKAVHLLIQIELYI